MHFHCELYLPNKTKPTNEQINEAMASFSEESKVNEIWKGTEVYWNNPNSIFDYCVVGGRWSGVHDVGYRAISDPANWEPCPICEGTGLRNDKIAKDYRAYSPSYTCNGCGRLDEKTKKWGHGQTPVGVRAKFPSKWLLRNCVTPVSEIDPNLTCHTMVIGGGVATGELPNCLEILQSRNINKGWMVTIDCHI